MIAGMVTPAIGLPIGGVLVNAWGWRTTFFVNIPVALVALGMAAFWIPRDPPIARPMKFREVAERIDAAGVVGFGGTMAALLVFLLSIPHPDWIALGLAVAVGAGLVGWELRARHPFFDVRLLASNLALTRTYLRWALAGLCIYTVLYGLTQWLQAGRGISAQETGLLLLPMSALAAVLTRPRPDRRNGRGRSRPRIPSLSSGSPGRRAGQRLSKRATSSSWPNIRAVSTAEGVPVVGSAPPSRRASITSRSPLKTAPASGVWPRSLGRSGSAPRASSAATVAAWPW